MNTKNNQKVLIDLCNLAEKCASSFNELEVIREISNLLGKSYDTHGWDACICRLKDNEIYGYAIKKNTLASQFINLYVNGQILYESFLADVPTHIITLEKDLDRLNGFRVFIEPAHARSRYLLIHIEDPETNNILACNLFPGRLPLYKSSIKNIAPAGYAFQSSLTRWSYSPEEANNALTGKFVKDYAFHTNNDTRAWWAVDLKRIQSICEIRIHLRPHMESRNRHLKIYASTDMQDWQCLDEAESTKDPAIITKKLDDLPCRFIKLEIENQFLHLCKVEIFADENIIPFRGCKLVDNSDVIAPAISALIRKGLYEKSEIEYALKHLQEDDIVLELGASLGAMSVVLNKHKPPKSYYAIEANPELIEVIETNHRLNEVKCEVINAAIGDEDRETDFYIHRACWASSLEKFPYFLRKEKIKMIKFDRLLKETKANFIICDIEGAEHLIFSEDIDLSGVNKIVIEIHGKKTEEISDLYTYFINKGFSCDKKPPQKGPHAVFFFNKIDSCEY